jgi:hypothetical protein
MVCGSLNDFHFLTLCTWDISTMSPVDSERAKRLQTRVIHPVIDLLIGGGLSVARSEKPREIAVARPLRLPSLKQNRVGSASPLLVEIGPACVTE